MPIFLHRDNQQLGPFTVAEVQQMLATGAASPNDMAWQDGMPAWIPLHDVPGVIAPAASAPAVSDMQSSPRRPIAVWIICLFYFICLPFAILGNIMIYMIVHDMIPVHLPDAQRELLAARTGIDDVIQVLSLALNLAWSVQLFRLRKQTIIFFIASMALGVVTLVYHAVARGHSDLATAGTLGVITLAVCWVLNLVLLGYMIHLTRKGVLR